MITWLAFAAVALASYDYNTMSMGMGGRCVLDGAGRMKCAGKDGFPWDDNRQYEIQIPPCDRFKAVGLNAYFSCAVKQDDGSIVCSPGLSSGDFTVRDSRSFKAVAPGWYFQCGILDNGDATCFGGGHGASYFPQSADWVTRPGPFAKVSGGTEYACGLKEDGMIECWGQINQLTNSNQGGFSMYIDHGNSKGVIRFPGTWKDLDMHSYGLCAIKDDGQIECYGRNDNKVGDNIPTDAGGYSQVALGYSARACAIKESDGTLDCFGENLVANTPTDVSFSKIWMSTDAACGLKTSDNSIMCWGTNTMGILDEPTGPSAQDMEDAGCPAPAFTCECENGTKADDDTCPADGESNCASCDDGYGLDGTECEKLYSCSLYTSKKFCATDHCDWVKGTGCQNKAGGSDLTSEQFCDAIKPKRICDGYDNCMFWFDAPKKCISKVKLTQSEICAKTRGKKNCRGPDCAFNTAQKRCMLPSENSCELYTKKAHCNKNSCVNGITCTWNKGNCEGGAACGAGGGGGSR